MRGVQSYCLFCKHWADGEKVNEYKIRHCSKWNKATNRKETCFEYERDGNLVRIMREYKPNKVKQYEVRNERVSRTC